MLLVVNSLRVFMSLPRSMVYFTYEGVSTTDRGVHAKEMSSQAKHTVSKVQEAAVAPALTLSRHEVTADPNAS